LVFSGFLIFFRSLQLVTDGYTLACPNQFGEVGVKGMVWKTCHAERLALNVLGAITPGECDAKYFGSFFRIIAVCLVEITAAE
jgi:hypothetical protein